MPPGGLRVTTRRKTSRKKEQRTRNDIPRTQIERVFYTYVSPRGLLLLSSRFCLRVLREINITAPAIQLAEQAEQTPTKVGHYSNNWQLPFPYFYYFDKSVFDEQSVH